jgi:adenylyl-sulfate kinase
VQRQHKLTTKRNVYYDSSLVSRAQQYAAVQQKGAMLWFTGLSGSGKSTVGRALEKRLLRRRIHVYRLDSDNIRIGLPRPELLRDGPRRKRRREGEIAALSSEAGVVTLVTLVTPFRARRDEVRGLHENMGVPFYEVLVDVPVSVAADRGVKCLHKRMIAGEIKEFTGISLPYEAPLQPELHLTTHNMILADEVDSLLAFLRPRPSHGRGQAAQWVSWCCDR